MADENFIVCGPDLFHSETGHRVNVLLCFVFTARIEDMKQGLLNKISDLGKELPLNTLDVLIDKFGGPDKVAEV